MRRLATINNALLAYDILVRASEKFSDGACEKNQKYLEGKLRHTDLEAFKSNILSTYSGVDQATWKKYWSQYKREKKLFNKTANMLWETSSKATITLKNMDTTLHTPNQRLEALVKYMVNEDNWKHGYCRYLWEKVFNNEFLREMNPDTSETPGEVTQPTSIRCNS